MSHKISEDGIVTFTGPDGSFSIPLVDLKETIDDLIVDALPNENTFTHDGYTFVAVRGSGCRGCAFSVGEFGDLCADKLRPACVNSYRLDGRDVIWELVDSVVESLPIKQPTTHVEKDVGAIDGYVPVDITSAGGCNNCAFDDRECQLMTQFPCTPSDRADGRNIFWRKIDE